MVLGGGAVPYERGTPVPTYINSVNLKGSERNNKQNHTFSSKLSKTSENTGWLRGGKESG